MTRISDHTPYFQTLQVRGAPQEVDAPFGFQAGPPPAPRRSRWLHDDFPWLTPRAWLLLALLVLGGVALGVQQLVQQLSRPPAQVLPVAQQQLRLLLDQVEECRGTESLLVMLPTGAERESALARLQRQQRQIDAWLRDNGAWLVASQGAQPVAELREALTAWRTLQQRIVQAEVVQGRTGLARESRNLMAGPSADVYRRITTTLDRLAQGGAR